MNFMEAVKAMKKGEKVRRRGWLNTNLGKVQLQWLIIPNYCIVADRETFDLSVGDYEATDWEIYEEEKDTWDLADCKLRAMVGANRDNVVFVLIEEDDRLDDFKPLFLEEHIKTFIQKVKEDLRLEVCKVSPVSNKVDMDEYNDWIDKTIDKRAGDLR